MAKSMPAAEDSNNAVRIARLRKKIKKMSWRQRALWVLVVVLIFTVGLLAYKYDQANKEATRLSANPQEAARKEVQELAEKVGKLMVVPTNETPTLATVSDASKLKNQAFFTKAQNGDKVLIYTQAKRAILYRPSTNKIIEVAPVNLGNNTNESEKAQ
jgi:hypothetical protein